MRVPIIAGNWKMNLTLQLALEYLHAIQGKLPAKNDVETIIAASPLFLASMVEINKTPLTISAEDCFYKNQGPYTGQVSPYALSKMGITHCLVGHSEIRAMFHESDTTINKKVHAIFNNQMIPILCCDETIHDSDAKSKDLNSLLIDLKGISSKNMQKVIVAYEPTWAIGTDHPATAKQAQQGCALIRNTIKDMYNQKVADQVRILYGGSVDTKNVIELMQQPDIDGILAGRDSLNPQEFAKLANYKNDFKVS